MGQKNIGSSEGGVEEHWVVSQPGCPHYRPVEPQCEPGYIHMVELRCSAHRPTYGDSPLDQPLASYSPGDLPARNSFITFKPDVNETTVDDTTYGQASSVAGRKSVFDQSPDVLASVNSISVRA